LRDGAGRVYAGQSAAALGYKLAANLREVAPDRAIWQLNDEAFDVAYRLQLERLGFDEITARLSRLALEHGNNRLVLLCFEDLRKAGESCHRQNFAAYWHEMTGELVPELEHRGPTEVTNTANRTHAVSTTRLAATIGAWVERNGHTLAPTAKSVRVLVDGEDVILSLFPGWDTVYFEIGKLRHRGMESDAEAILGRLREVSSRPVTLKQPGVLTADLLSRWETVESEILPRLVDAYRLARRSQVRR
jgi:hypothetical protein